MARCHWMLSKKVSQDAEQHASTALSYAYHVFRFIEGLNMEGPFNTEPKTPYTFCNAIRIGHTPALFFAATLLNNTSWHKWAAGKLRIIKREGLYNGLYLAKALDLLDVFRSHTEQLPDSSPATGVITPVLFPDAEDRSLAIYYVRSLPRSSLQNATPVQILGRACWEKASETRAENLSVEFYGLESEINGNLMGTCAYWRISKREPHVKEWRELFYHEGMDQEVFDLEIALSGM
jgi:hypothetical protein